MALTEAFARLEDYYNEAWPLPENILMFENMPRVSIYLSAANPITIFYTAEASEGLRTADPRKSWPWLDALDDKYRAGGVPEGFWEFPVGQEWLHFLRGGTCWFRKISDTGVLMVDVFARKIDSRPHKRQEMVKNAEATVQIPDAMLHQPAAMTIAAYR